MLQPEEVENTKVVAEARIRMQIDDLVDRILVNESITTLDAIVYSSCGGDLQRLIAEAALQSLCTSLGQNPIDLLEHLAKNGMNTEGGGADGPKGAT